MDTPPQPNAPAEPDFESEPPSDPFGLIPVNDGWGNSFRRAKKKAKAYEEPESKKASLWDEFGNFSSSTGDIQFEPRKNRDACEIYTEVFMAHARLYVFADEKLIEPLKKLSLYRLQRTLAVFHLYEERIDDIVQLLQWI